MNYNWSWSVFLDMSPDGVHTFLETLLIGVGWTLALSLIAWVFSLLLGSCLGVMRTASSRALNLPARPMSRCSATSRCWCRCSSGISCCPSCCRMPGAWP